MTLPIKDSNPPIDDGLDARDRWRLQDPQLRRSTWRRGHEELRREHDVAGRRSRPTTTTTRCSPRSAQPGESFDLVFPGPSVLSKMVYTELIQPLNHSYVPNLKNVWPEYQDPWYDRGARYTVPVHGLRHGRALSRRPGDERSRGRATTCSGTTQYAGKVYLLDDMQEAIGMSLLRNNISTDINTSDPDLVQKATDSLIELIDLVNDQDERQRLLRGPRGHRDDPPVLVRRPDRRAVLPARRARPPTCSATGGPRTRRSDVIGSDNIAIPKCGDEAGARAPDDQRPARQPDRRCRTSAGTATSRRSPSCPPQYLIDQGYIPENLMNAVVLPGDFNSGLTFYEVSPSTEALWRNYWSRFKAGA